MQPVVKVVLETLFEGGADAKGADSSSVSVYLVSPIWWGQARFRCKVDGRVPSTQDFRHMKSQLTRLRQSSRLMSSCKARRSLEQSATLPPERDSALAPPRSG